MRRLITLRSASSGASDATCLVPEPTGNESVLAGDPCFPFAGAINGARLPSFKQLDLRTSKSIRIESQELVAYLDGRNILNFSNIVNVFATTALTTNPVELARTRSLDSAGWANEALQNGAFAPTATSTSALPGRSLPDAATG